MNKTLVSLLVGLASLLSVQPCFAANSSLAGSCEVQCGQALSRCEHKLGPAGSCARRLSNCNTECTQGKPRNVLTGKQQKKALCEQRCDLNRTICEEANPQQIDQCVAGQQSCIKRCS